MKGSKGLKVQKGQKAGKKDQMTLRFPEVFYG